MALEYTALVIEHFKHPRNVGEISAPDAEATVGSPACGDMLHMSMKLEGRTITDVKFRSYGCASSISTGSMVTEMLKGKTMDDAEQLTWKEVIEALGGLPPVKVHCSVLAIDTLKEAVRKWKIARGEAQPERLELNNRNARMAIGDVVHGGQGQTLAGLDAIYRVKADKAAKTLHITLNVHRNDPFWENITEEIEEHLRQQWGMAELETTTIASADEIPAAATAV